MKILLLSLSFIKSPTVPDLDKSGRPCGIRQVFSILNLKLSHQEVLKRNYVISRRNGWDRVSGGSA